MNANGNTVTIGRFDQAVRAYLDRQFGGDDRPWLVTHGPDRDSLIAASKMPPAEIRMLSSRNGAASVEHYYGRLVDGMAGDLRDVAAACLGRPVGRVTCVIDPVRQERRIVLQIGPAWDGEGLPRTDVRIL
jgi:hypothetical protein